MALLVLLLGPAAIAFYLQTPLPARSSSGRSSSCLSASAPASSAADAGSSSSSSSSSGGVRRGEVSRRDWGAAVVMPGAALGLGLFGLVGAAGAAGSDKAGTKDDPAYQVCSQSCVRKRVLGWIEEWPLT